MIYLKYFVPEVETIRQAALVNLTGDPQYLDKTREEILYWNPTVAISEWEPRNHPVARQVFDVVFVLIPHGYEYNRSGLKLPALITGFLRHAPLVIVYNMGSKRIYRIGKKEKCRFAGQSVLRYLIAKWLYFRFRLRFRSRLNNNQPG